MYVGVSGLYKPRRDIPVAVRELKTFSPSRIRDWIQEHKTKKDRVTGNRVQVNVTSQSISMWFKRHTDILRKLKTEVINEELETEAVSETIFENGAFRRVPCIKTWILELEGRNAKEESIKNFVGSLKRICVGKIRKNKDTREYEVIEGWGIKHPQKLGIEDGLIYLSEMRKRELPNRSYRLALRNFFESKGLKGRHKISGQIEHMGKYAHLKAPKEKLHEILQWLKQMNKEAYLAVKLAYKCGGWRIDATMTAHAKRINFEAHTIRIIEKATKGKGKRIQEKMIPDDVWKELEDIGRLNGQLVRNITEQEIRDLLKKAYREIIPNLGHCCPEHGEIPSKLDRCPECNHKAESQIPMPFHFWRHQFAQHMLDATDWNYGLVASLGDWTVGTLERYYGKMNKREALESGRKHALKL